MAVNIATMFDSLYLSAHLPENVYVTTDQKSVEIKVFVDGDKAFSSTYYPFNGNITFHGLRSIVEAAMYDQALDMARLEIEALSPDGKSSVVDDVYVIYGDFKMPYGSESFIKGSFLTTRKSAVIPRNGHLLLHYYAQANQAASNYYLIRYRVSHIPNEVFEYSHILNKYDSDRTMVKTMRYTHDMFKQIVDNAKGTTSIICYVEIHLGMKSFTVFFTDEQPTELLDFLNAFMMTETAYIYGVNTVKTDVERSEAVIGSSTQFYDQQVTVKHEVETAALPMEEAQWLNQLFTSKWVTRPIGNGKSVEVLISDISSEVTDSDKEQTRLKFSWRYADGDERLVQ